MPEFIMKLCEPHPRDAKKKEIRSKIYLARVDAALASKRSNKFEKKEDLDFSLYN